MVAKQTQFLPYMFLLAGWLGTGRGGIMGPFQRAGSSYKGNDAMTYIRVVVGGYIEETTLNAIFA